MQNIDLILEPIIKSHKFPEYVEKLQLVLQDELQKRSDFYNWLDEDKRAEFILGEVIIHSPARAAHMIVLKKIARKVDDFVEEKQLGTVFTEQALIRLIRSDVMPDLAFWKGKTFAGDIKIFPAPDFIIEVLSPSTERVDREKKSVEYALNGVNEYWIIDPDKQTAEQFILLGEEYELREKLTHGTIRCVVLKGLEIGLEEIF